MKTRIPIVGVLIVAVTVMPACRVRNTDYLIDEDLPHFIRAATNIEYPDVSGCGEEAHPVSPAPFRISDYEQAEFWDLTLQEAVQIALANSPVLRDLGGTVLRTPATVKTAFDPAVVETDPRFGIEAALSAFDTDFNTRVFAEQNDRRLNNQFLGDLGFLRQNFGVFETELQKRAATGSQFILRKNVEFDKNSSLGNEFPGGSWSVFVEGEMRQPLLQGAGLPFNRIAGPDGGPGAINGVLVARVRTDISLAEFELGVRDLVANVENAYWDLYYAYRDLDAKIAARDASLETWRRINALAQTGRRGGEAEKEAQAREQYFQFKLEVENALTGRLLEGTRTNNGSSGGTFRGSPGIYVNERRMRFVMGLPMNDGRLMRPAEEPPTANVAFDWGQSSGMALFRRAELRRTKWEVKRREMELVASRNLLLPNLDFVGRYRFRGFGDHLLNSYRNRDRDGNGVPDYNNAYQNLTSGDFQEWQMGFEFSMPIGFRQAHTQLRNAELQLARARAVLREQEHQIMHDLSDAISEVDRAYNVMRTSYNRLRAAKDQLDAVEAAFDADKVEFFVVLDSQRRLADTASQYYQSQVEFSLSLRNVHFERGTLLDYCGVALSEGAWPNKAFIDAASRERRRGRPMKVRSTHINPPIVSQGDYPQASLMDPDSEPQAPFDPFLDDPYEIAPSGPPASPPVPPASVQHSAPPELDVPVDTLYSKFARKLSRMGVGVGPAGPPPATNPQAAASAPDYQAVEPPRRWLPAGEMPVRGETNPQNPRFGSSEPLVASNRGVGNPEQGFEPSGPQTSRNGVTADQWSMPHPPQAGPTVPGATPQSNLNEPPLEWSPPTQRHTVSRADSRPLGPPPQLGWRELSSKPAPETTSEPAKPLSHGDSRRSSEARLSVHVTPDGHEERAAAAARWSPTDQQDTPGRDTSAMGPPQFRRHSSMRFSAEPRVERLIPSDPSAPQLRFQSKEPPRRLPPVTEMED